MGIGKENIADYVTNDLPICHHRTMRPRCVQAKKNMENSNDQKLGPKEGVLELPIPGEPGNLIIPLRESRIQFPGAQIIH